MKSRQAETNYYTARNDIAELRTRIAVDRNAPDLLVGGTVEPAPLPVALGDARATVETLPADLSFTVLLRCPDVLQAEHQLIAQNANIGAVRAAFFPTISLTAALGTIVRRSAAWWAAARERIRQAPLSRCRCSMAAD